jgi:hypothetical protein
MQIVLISAKDWGEMEVTVKREIARERWGGIIMTGTQGGQITSL